MKVTLGNIKEVVITKISKTTVENLTKYEATTNSPRIYWCNGILFNHYDFDNESSFQEITKGMYYIDTIFYAESDKVSSSKWNGYDVEVHDLTGDKIMESITKAIKEAAD